MSVAGKELGPQVCDMMVVVALVPLLICWSVAAGLPWLMCRLVWQQNCWSLPLPQESRCHPAHTGPGHGAHCPSGYHPYSTRGWSHCGHHFLRN